MEDIKPTRSELIKLKKKVKLAFMGYDLLKRKKDGLIQEFFKLLEIVKENRAALQESYRESVGRLELTRALDGTAMIESTALAIEHHPKLTVGVKNIMGVSVPEIDIDYLEDEEGEFDYGVIGTSSYMDSLVESYQNVLKKSLISAEAETALKRLLLEIEKTRRRVSALEFIVIPNMQTAAAYIQLRLDELERENIFRLKRVKKKSMDGR